MPNALIHRLMGLISFSGLRHVRFREDGLVDGMRVRLPAGYFCDARFDRLTAIG